MSTQKQETRSMIITMKVTPTEKRMIEFVAGAKRSDVSDLLRQMGVSQIMEEHQRISEVLNGLTESAA
jgi:hypothetical protein